MGKVVRSIFSRGIPSKKSIKFEYDNLPMSLNSRWEFEDILKLIFPPELQPSQYEISLKLVNNLKSNPYVTGEMLSNFIKSNDISNATIRNLVIPKLVRMGLLARERINPSGQSNSDKHREMILTLSKRFGNSFTYIGNEWNLMVESIRMKQKK